MRWRTKFIEWVHEVERAPRAVRWSLVIAIAAIVGAADLGTGRELSFVVFHLLPIGAAAWLLGLRAGMVLAGLSAALGFALDVATTTGEFHSLASVGSALIRLVGFGVAAAFLSALERSDRRLRLRIAGRSRRLRREALRRRQMEQDFASLSAWEQENVADRIHDDLGQYLSALLYSAQMLADDLRAEGSPSASKAERMISLLRQTNVEVRRLARTLRAPESRPDGLAAALRELGEDFERLTGVAFRVSAPASVTVDPFRAQALVRIVQEACSNAVKHGRPTAVWIRIVVDGENLTVQVCANGCAVMAQQKKDDGTGLRIMRRRAELIGAHLQVEFSEFGSAVHCSLPLPATLRCA